MKNKTFAFLNKNRILIILLFVLLIVHLFLPLNWSDDAVFLKKTADKDILTFLNGSARPFTDGLTYIFSRNQWLWRILNPFVLTTAVWAVNETAPLNNISNKTLLICLSVIFPTFCLADAGFVATTVNYLWPVTFGILNLIPLINSFNGKKTNAYLLVLLIPMLAYATNMQQLCAVLLAVFLIANFCFIFVKKEFKPYIILQLVITIAGTLFSLFANFAGDNSRMFRETNRYFPEFGELGFLEKFELGFSSTFYCMTMELRQAFLGFIALSVFLIVFTFKSKKNIYQKILSFIPATVSLVFGILSLIPSASSYVNMFTGKIQNYGIGKSTYTFELIPDIMFLIICVIIMYNIWILINKTKLKIIAEFIFLLGLGSRIMMGFSPTVWASGYRTYCILFISFVYISLIITDNNTINKSQKPEKLH